MNVAPFIVPMASAALVLLAILAIFAFVKNCRLNVPPNTVAVISGRAHVIDGTKRGYRLVRGGGTFVIPIFERQDELSLTTINIPDLVVKDGITKEGAPLTVRAVANIKIGSEDALLVNAVERLLGKPDEAIRRLAYETLEGHLRSILGTLTIESINNDRQAFQTRMIEESQTDLARLGLKIDVLTVKELSDSSGYLDALGKTRVAQVKRDADIGAAEAARESTIKSTTAQREGEVRKQDNQAQVAEAEKQKNVKVALYAAETNAEQARAEQAGPLAKAEAQKKVVEAEQGVILAKTIKATEVAQAEATRKEQELIATQIKPAEAAREAAIATAEGVARAKIIEAEAEARAIAIKADAERARLTAEGQGRADAKKAELLAEADGTRAKLLAEAEGTLKRAEAFKALDESGRLLQILEAAQTLVPKVVHEFAGVMAAAAEPLGNAEKIVLIDGGGNGDGQGAVQRFGATVPQMVFGLLERAAAVGLDLSGALAKAGVKTETAK